MKDVWILEDDKTYRKNLERAVARCGFEPVSFVAWNTFLQKHSKANKENIYGMIFDNQFPRYEMEPGSVEDNLGIEIIDRLNSRGLLEGVKVVLYTFSEMNKKIEKVCGMGVRYEQKVLGVGCGWVGEFLNRGMSK